MPSPRGPLVGRRIVTTLLSVLVLAAACSTGTDSSSTTQTTRSNPKVLKPAQVAKPRSEPARPEAFTGSAGDFYVVPKSLPKGEPGQLIRVQKLAVADGVASVRVMYHSRDAQDRDRAVTGVISYPTSPAPAKGWPVVSWAHGTTGLISRCAPSRTGGPAPAFGIEGVDVATDYIGLGPVGEIHPYLSGPSEGNSVIDAVRAARHLPQAHASNHWLAIGHSQGGHAALFAGERAESYAPELDLLGTVSVAPASELAKRYGPVDEVVARVVGLMALYGAAAEHPEIKFGDYVGPQVAAASKVIGTDCLAEIVSAIAGLPAATFYKVDPLQTEPASSVFLKENDPGQVAADSPLFLVEGSADTTVFPARVRDLFDRLCQTGQVTQFLTVDGANHGDEITKATKQIHDWMAARIAGSPATNSCK